MGKIPPNIEAHPEKCSGCLRCQLTCSLEFSGLFNPSQAYIIISHDPRDNSISFSDDCTECGLCADACVYGALQAV